MYATTRASLADQAARSARPRPLRSSRSTCTPPSVRASTRAIAGVSSVLALSAITIRHVNGNSASRKRWRRRMLRSSPACSL